MMELAGDGIVPGPSHRRPVSSTSTGRETEQVRVTVVPDMTGEGGEDVREMLASATQRQRAFVVQPCLHTILTQPCVYLLQ